MLIRALSVVLLVLCWARTIAPEFVVPDINYEILRIVHNERIASVTIRSCGNVPPYLLSSLSRYGAAVNVLCDSDNSSAVANPIPASSAPACLIVDRLGRNSSSDNEGADGASSPLEADLKQAQDRGYNFTMAVDWQNATLAVLHGNTSLQFRSAEMKEDQANPTAVFSSIYRSLKWTAAGGGSGKGSTVQITEKVRKVLVTVVRRFKVRSMIDAPCGSFVWMPRALVELPHLRYTGVDIACNVIQRLQQKHDLQRHRFHCMDVCHQDFLHGADMIFTRDALMHLPYSYTFDFLENVKRSKARYLFVGSFYKNFFNHNVRVGSYYAINLLAPPFNLSSPIATFKEMKDQA
eukprot:EG_transcript_18223